MRKRKNQKLRASSSWRWVNGGDGPKTSGVGYYGTIVTSADLENLHVRTSGTTKQLNAITFGNGVFVVVGALEQLLFHLTMEQHGHLHIQIHLNNIAYGNGTFAAVGNSGSILISTDNGSNWTAKSSGTGSTLIQ